MALSNGNFIEVQNVGSPKTKCRASVLLVAPRKATPPSANCRRVGKSPFFKKIIRGKPTTLITHDVMETIFSLVIILPMGDVYNKQGPVLVLVLLSSLSSSSAVAVESFQGQRRLLEEENTNEVVVCSNDESEDTAIRDDDLSRSCFGTCTKRSVPKMSSLLFESGDICPLV